MPKAFPTGVSAYLKNLFPTLPDKIPVLDIQANGPKIAGFLDLYDHIPEELFQLPDADLTELMSAVAAIKLGVEQYRTRGGAEMLNQVRAPLRIAYSLLLKMPDQAIAERKDLAFIKDGQLRSMIALDIAAIQTGLTSREWKGATIIAGSCCEALLLYGLLAKKKKSPGIVSTAVAAVSWPTKKPDANDLTDRSWDLYSYSVVAKHCRLISDNTWHLLEPARDYRNLIHPAKAIREQTAFHRGTAYAGSAAVDYVIVDLIQNLK